tara:strand:+ start:99 stop:407 length:309 start_codon:yes stop_codon:yes gene_type:complete
LELIYFILASFGMTQILVYGSIFNSVRPPKEKYAGFFHCPMCLGFWVGVFLLGINAYTELFTYDLNIANALLLGCISSGTSYVLTMLFGDWGIRYEYHNKKD